MALADVDVNDSYRLTLAVDHNPELVPVNIILPVLKLVATSVVTAPAVALMLASALM